ncbi:tetratricopeptide repeat protein [Altibacter sp. HG106]|uniref:tetratricopeptide repeat protein n=1 Tax=Altibacter sp. HG106 TaxID=3023937 RepID=UPI0023501D48|nr:tetratricopeptide repeat protein [Altibacter sp. HG106]MDC7996387.1 tetratricopeptide repeat protein [Altibacter sp. HG106]
MKRILSIVFFLLTLNNIQSQSGIFEGTKEQAQADSKQKNILTVCVDGGRGSDGKTKYTAKEYAQLLVKMFNNQEYTRFPTQLVAYYNETNSDEPTYVSIYMDGIRYVNGDYNYFRIYSIGKSIDEIAEDYAVSKGLTVKKEVKDLMVKANQDDPKALYDLSICYLYGRGIKKDETLGIKHLRQSEKLGYIKAQFTLGDGYEYGWYGLSEDKELAYEWFSKNHRNGGAASAKILRYLELEIGNAYLKKAQENKSNDEVVRINCIEALKWFQLAVDNEYHRAYHELGMAQLLLSTVQTGKKKQDTALRGLSAILLACDYGDKSACKMAERLIK